VALTYDHFIVAQRVTQAATDNSIVAGDGARGGATVGFAAAAVVADSGHFSLQNLKQSEQRGIAGSVPNRIRTWPAS